MVKDYIFEKRKYIIGGTVLVVVFIYCFRLFELQILSNSYKENADSNAFLNKTQDPARGAIYDRNGKLLVFNQPAYDVSVIMREVNNLDTLDFCRALNISYEYFLKRMDEIRKSVGYSRYTPQIFVTQLSAEEIGVFQEKLFKFQGFDVHRRAIRRYSYNSAAHALGDMGEVSKKEIANDDYYVPGDYIGKQGVERSYERYLRGEKGVEVLLRDAHGRIQGSYQDGALDKKPVPGKNLTLSLDIELQMLGEQLLQNKRGAIVAIEPKTGEILAMVTAPSYDPSLMVGRQRGANHLLLSKENQSKPLLNRAISEVYPPGSTFKPAQGLTFLQEEIIDLDTKFPCSHAFVYGGLRVGCHGHGTPIPFIPSIATSCNAYYCWGLFRMIDNKKYESSGAALDLWRDYMTSMGFGSALGVDLPGEVRGFIPNSQFYNKVLKTEKWGALRIISISIGQGEITLTPLQIANLGATIANRGHFITPHIVKGIEDNELDSLYRTPRHTAIDPHYYDYIVQGMREAVTGNPYGSTCRRANIPGLEICGKTGTAQNRGKDHSVFMGFAPMDNPEIAICVYVENGGFGATWGVPIGTLMIEKYLKGEIAPERKSQVEYISNANIIPYELQKR